MGVVCIHISNHRSALLATPKVLRGERDLTGRQSLFLLRLILLTNRLRRDMVRSGGERGRVVMVHVPSEKGNGVTFINTARIYSLATAI